MIKLVDIEGVGEAFATLRKAGVGSASSLLERGATVDGRKELMAKSGLSDTVIIKCVHAADLRRVDGVTEKFAELLEATGVETVPQLAHRNAEHLATALTEINADLQLVPSVPSHRQLARWIEQAKALPRVVTHLAPILTKRIGPQSQA